MYRIYNDKWNTILKIGDDHFIQHKDKIVGCFLWKEKELILFRDDYNYKITPTLKGKIKLLVSIAANECFMISDWQYKTLWDSKPLQLLKLKDESVTLILIHTRQLTAYIGAKIRDE